MRERAKRKVIASLKTPGTKYCWYCKKILPLSRFSKDKSRPDGLNAECKDCASQRWRILYYTKMKGTEKLRADRRRGRQAYRKRHPEKVRAHQAASRIPLKKSCERCGGSDHLHRHHPDYSKPLAVITLCHKCHREEHKQAA